MTVVTGRRSATARATFTCFLLVLLLLLRRVNSDLAEDKKECSDQLVVLSTCLDFVSGKASAPGQSCCAKLREKINESKKCLCLLVKDRNDPDLGFKVNATLALSLPSICHAASNASECIELLNLSPNSTDAQVFRQYAAASHGSNTSSVNVQVTGDPTSSSSSSTLRRKGWIAQKVDMVLLLTYHLLVLFVTDV